MPHPSEIALWAADSALPHLGLVMDANAVSRLLGLHVIRKYVRYKPGASAIVLYETGNSLVSMETMADAKKLADKSRGPWPKGSLGIGRLKEQGFIVWEFPCDRVLPAIKALNPEAIQVLAYKPQRRLVIRHDHKVSQGCVIPGASGESGGCGQ